MANNSFITIGNSSLQSNQNSVDALPHVDSRTAKGFKVIAYVIVLVASVIGNLFVISAMKKDNRGKLRRRFTYLIITSIALSDLLMAVVSIPERITRVVSSDEWLISGSLGLLLCKVVNFVEKVSITVSALQVMAMAAHRFLAIFYPRRNSKSRNCRLATICITVVWLFSVIYWSPVLYYGGLLSLSNPSRLYCKVRLFYPHWKLIYLAFLILLLAILVVVFVLYSAIWLKLYCSKTLRDENIAAEMRRKTTTMVAVIVVTFYCCFLPYWLGWIICSFQQVFCSQVFTFISIYLTHASVAVNPIICLIFSRHYRSALKELLTSSSSHQNQRHKRVEL